MSKTEKRKRYAKAYYVKNKERILAVAKAYAAAHREDTRNYQKQWRQDNPEKVKSYYAAKRAADKKTKLRSRLEQLLKGLENFIMEANKHLIP